MEKTFLQKFNECRENFAGIFGIELFNTIDKEYNFDYITYDEKNNTLNWNDYSIVVDDDFSVDENLQSLFEEIMQSGIYEN